MKPDTQKKEHAEFHTLHGHSDTINGVSFSPKEGLLASTSDDNTTRVWDYTTGLEQYRFEDPGNPRCVCFSTDGLTLATGCSDGTICVRSLRKATDVSLSCPSLVSQISFSPTASNILAAFRHDSTLHVWDLDDQQQLLVNHAREPRPARYLQYFIGFVFSPDGQTIAVRRNRDIAVVDIIDSEVLSEFRVSDKAVVLAFSIDSRILAVRMTGSISFWDVTTSCPRLLNSYEASWNPYSFLHLPADENFNVHQGPSGTVELFETSTGYPIGKFQKKLGGESSHDGALRIDKSSHHPVIRVFGDLSTPKLFYDENSAPDNVKLLDDSIALSYNLQRATKIWDVANGSMQPFCDCVRAIKLSTDGDLVILRLNKGDKFQVWKKDLKQSKVTLDKMADIAFVPGTGHLVTLSLSGKLQFLEWGTESCSFNPTWSFGLGDVVFEEIPDPQLILTRAPTLYVSPSGQEVVINHEDSRYGPRNTISCQLWDLKKRTKVKQTLLVTVSAITFSPANDFFSAECDLNTRLFHMSNGEEVEDCDLNGYASLTFHPVHSIFAVRLADGNSIGIWEGLPWTKKKELKVAQNYYVGTLALSSTKIAASSSLPFRSGSTIDIWDIVTGQKIYSHAFELSGWNFFFKFSTDETCLESSRGCILLPIQHSTANAPGHEWKGAHKCLYVLDEWIFQGHDRLLWLPAEYRPTEGSGKVDVQGGTIALAHKDNSVVFIGIELEKTPVAERYMRRNRYQIQ